MYIRYLVLIVLSMIGFSFSSVADEEEVFHSNQTSASMLIKYAERSMKNASAEESAQAERRFVILYDIYIKAKSYAFLNKVFFLLSIVFAFIVLLWPSLSILFKSKLDKWEWLKSATVQTTVTAIAALMFTFYSQYKDKQTYAETLMRYVVFSNKSPSELSIKVSDELSKIDRGFSFNSVLGDDSASQ